MTGRQGGRAERTAGGEPRTLAGKGFGRDGNRDFDGEPGEHRDSGRDTDKGGDEDEGRLGL